MLDEAMVIVEGWVNRYLAAKPGSILPVRHDGPDGKRSVGGDACRGDDLDRNASGEQFGEPVGVVGQAPTEGRQQGGDDDHRSVQARRE